MNEFVVFTLAETNRRVCLSFSDKKIVRVFEDDNYITVIRFKELIQTGLLSHDYRKEETIKVKEPFENVLEKLGIKEGETA